MEVNCFDDSPPESLINTQDPYQHTTNTIAPRESLQIQESSQLVSTGRLEPGGRGYEWHEGREKRSTCAQAVPADNPVPSHASTRSLTCLLKGCIVDEKGPELTILSM